MFHDDERQEVLSEVLGRDGVSVC